MIARHRKCSPYLLWIGGVVAPNSVLTRRAVSPAGNRWQLRMLEALDHSAFPTYVISYCPEPQWPSGAPFVMRHRDALPQGLTGELVGYVNLPLVKQRHLGHQIRAEVRQVVRRFGVPMATISYNFAPAAKSAALFARQKWSVPWACIVADATEQNVDERYGKHPYAQADGVVFLSWKAFEESTHPCRMHLDGGVSEIRGSDTDQTEDSNDPVQRVVYTGTLTKQGGVDPLIRAFARVRHPDARLVICGKGQNKTIDHATSRDQRIDFLGMVSEERLMQVQREASVFVNPRPPEYPQNAYNFPSKVLVYLSFGKPVVSTWTGGLDPAYQDVLLVGKADEAGLAEQIEKALAMKKQERLLLRARILDFLQTSRTWTKQAKRFKDWLLDAPANSVKKSV